MLQKDQFCSQQVADLKLGVMWGTILVLNDSFHPLVPLSVEEISDSFSTSGTIIDAPMKRGKKLSIASLFGTFLSSLKGGIM